MSKVEDLQINKVQESEMSQRIDKDSGQMKQRETSNKKSPFVQDIVGVTLALVTFFSMMIWYINAGYCVDLTSFWRNDTVKKLQKIPSIYWYNELISSSRYLTWIHPKRKISCFNGSRFYGCDVYQPGTKLDYPDAFLVYGGVLNHLPLPRDPETIWGLLLEETPIARLMFMHEEALNLFNFSATFSRYSDVPMPLLWLRGLHEVINTKFFVNTSTKNSLLSKFAPVMYLQSHCDTSTRRDEYVTKLMDYIQVDSYGECVRNKQFQVDTILNKMISNFSRYYHLYHVELLKFISQYKFFVSIESGVCNDYVSEKFWRAIEVGTVPIYFGSPLIRDWLPNNKSAILLEDFPTPKLLSQHLHYLLKNDTAYEEYLEHKTSGRISNQNLIDELEARPYQTDLEETAKRFECFICERLHNDVDKSVNIVTKKHYDCPPPTTALQLTVDPSNRWIKYVNEAKSAIDQLYEEIWSGNRTRRDSQTILIDIVYLRKILFNIEI